MYPQPWQIILALALSVIIHCGNVWFYGILFHNIRKLYTLDCHWAKQIQYVAIIQVGHIAVKTSVVPQVYTNKTNHVTTRHYSDTQDVNLPDRRMCMLQFHHMVRISPQANTSWFQSVWLSKICVAFPLITRCGNGFFQNSPPTNNKMLQFN